MELKPDIASEGIRKMTKTLSDKKSKGSKNCNGKTQPNQFEKIVIG